MIYKNKLYLILFFVSIFFIFPVSADFNVSSSQDDLNWQVYATTPISLTSDDGNFWVNWSWGEGTRRIPPSSWNVSINGTWHNETTNTYYNQSTTPHGWVNIIVWGYNNTNSVLSQSSLSGEEQAASGFAPSSNQSSLNWQVYATTPINLTNATGAFWVNWSWEAGSGRIPPTSWNVSWNGTWYNGTTNKYMKRSVPPLGWANISVWGYNSTDDILSEASVSGQQQAPGTDTTFTVSLPTGYTKPVFQPPNSTATNYPPNGQNSSQEFYNVTNTGNVNLDVRMRLNTTVSTITFKADADNNPTGADTIGTSLVTVYPSLVQGSSADIWLWSDFDHTPAQTANRTIYINVSQS